MPHNGIDDGQIVSVRFARRIRKVPIFPPSGRYIWALDTTAHSDDAVDMAGQVCECFAVLPFCYHVDAVMIFKDPASVLIDGSGWVPAETLIQVPPARWRDKASAIWLRHELCVQTKAMSGLFTDFRVPFYGVAYETKTNPVS